MDAMIFFAFAAIASSVLIQSASAPHSPSGETYGEVDLKGILESFLQASVGREIVLSIDQETSIPADAQMAEVLALVVSSEAQGWPNQSASFIEDVLARTLKSLEPPSSDLFLMIYSMDLGNLELSIPRAMPSASNQFAASAIIPGSDEEALLVSMILQPAFLPEILDVRVGDLDLRPCVAFSLREGNQRNDDQ